MVLTKIIIKNKKIEFFFFFFVGQVPVGFKQGVDRLYKFVPATGTGRVHGREYCNGAGTGIAKSAPWPSLKILNTNYKYTEKLARYVQLACAPF